MYRTCRRARSGGVSLTGSLSPPLRQRGPAANKPVPVRRWTRYARPRPGDHELEASRTPYSAGRTVPTETATPSVEARRAGSPSGLEAQDRRGGTHLNAVGVGEPRGDRIRYADSEVSASPDSNKTSRAGPRGPGRGAGGRSHAGECAMSKQDEPNPTPADDVPSIDRRGVRSRNAG